MTLLFFGAVAVLLVALVLGVSSGRIPVDPLADATHSTPDHGLPASPVGGDVDAVRFDTAPTGYDPREVDPALDRLRDILDQQERRIASLRESAQD